VRELAACREAQPLAACSLWLRTSVALDAAPCSGLALVAGTESEHGVPVPLPDSHGRDVERGGFTRAIAQSCRPDDCSDDARFAAEWLPATGAGRVAAGGGGAPQAGSDSRGVAAEASAIGRHLSTLCQALLCSRSRRSQQPTGDVIGGTNARGPRTESTCRA